MSPRWYAGGAWNPQGGQAGGRRCCTASTLTKVLAERFGDDVRFGLAGRKAAAKVYALDLKPALRRHERPRLGPRRPRQAQADPGPPRRQRALASRIAGGPNGRDAGRRRRHRARRRTSRFAGSGTVADADLGGYGPARVSGPIELARQKAAYALKAKLTGAGGPRAGFVAALLGGAPTASLEGAAPRQRPTPAEATGPRGPWLKVQARGSRACWAA